jgi:hypothetical protein
MEVSLDCFRYIIALVILLCAPPALLIWLLIHPFVSMWRRLGMVRSYLFLISLMILLGWCIWQSRTWLMRFEYGLHFGLFGLSVLFICAAGFFRVRRMRCLGWPVVIGLPELSASNHSRVLVTQGIYSKVRNPRYLETILFLFGLAFFANYLAVYLALVAGLPILHAVVLLEERELTQTFGDAYLSYSQKVPRYIPNLFH